MPKAAQKSYVIDVRQQWESLFLTNLCCVIVNVPAEIIVPFNCTGPIPKELGQLVYLKELDLHWNKLHGERKPS